MAAIRPCGPSRAAPVPPFAAPGSGDSAAVVLSVRTPPVARCLANGRSGHFAQAARLDLVDEAAEVLLAGDERARLDAGERLADVLVQVAERLGGPRRLDARVLLDLVPEVVVVEREHAAVRVVDEHDLFGAEEPLGDRERADLVVGDDAAGVAD